MRLASHSYRPRLDLLESRLQPGSVLDGSLNLSLLAGDLGLLSGGLFASLDDAALVAPPAPSQELQSSFSVLQGMDLTVLVPVVPQAPLEREASGGLASEQMLEAIQNAVPIQTPQGTIGRRGNCIVNGDFETGDLTGWTVGDPKDKEVGVDDIAAYTGAFGAYFGTVDALNTLTQTCETPAKAYTISFFLQNLEGGDPTVFFVTWGDEALLYLENAAPFPYQQFVFENVPTPNLQTALTFFEQHNPDYWELDDVVIVAS